MRKLPFSSVAIEGNEFDFDIGALFYFNNRAGYGTIIGKPPKCFFANFLFDYFGAEFKRFAFFNFYYFGRFDRRKSLYFTFERVEIFQWNLTSFHGRV